VLLCFWVHTIGRSSSGARSDCGCAYEICNDLFLNRFRGFCGLNAYISVEFLDNYIIYGLLRLFQYIWLIWKKCFPLVIFLIYRWKGGSFSLLDDSGWRRGAVAQGVAHFMLWSMMAVGPALDNSWIRSRSGVVWGVGRSFGHSIVFLTFIFIYLLCLFFLLSSFLVCHLFSFHIFFVHSIWFLLKSSRSGRIIVCNSKSAGRRAVCSMRGGLFRDSYADILYPSNEGNSLVFWWIAVTLLWPGRGDFSTSGLSTFKKIVLISVPDYKNWFRVIKD
jgi:hypothetical protein